MNKDNEKTFADLFNSSEEIDNASNASFDDIFKSSEKGDDSNSKQEVFGDDSSSDKDVHEDEKVSFGGLVFDDDIFSNHQDDSRELESEDTSLGNDEDTSSIISQDDSHEIEKEDNIQDDSNIFGHADIFFNKGDDSSEIEKEDNSQDSVKDDSNIFGHDDIFFNKGDDSSEIEKEDISKDSIKDDSNIASQDNIFFNKGDDSSGVEKEDNSQDSVKDDSNLFFQEDEGLRKSEDEIIPDVSDRVVFDRDDNIQDISGLTLKNQPQESILNEINSDKKEVVEKNVSESPFFSQDVKKNSNIEENPLFLNTLNLVENENQEKKNTVIDVNKSRHFNVKIVKKKEPLFKVIIGIISYAIFIWLLLVGVTLLIYVLDIKIRASKGDYSSPTYNAYVVLTGSMLPEIQVYDVVLTKKVDPNDLKVGDVITFASADTRFLGTIITHRIKQKEYNSETKSYSFQTKGDNNNVVDSAWVPQNNIYGKVILKIPKLGYLQEFLAADGGWIIVILIPCLAVISYDIVKLIKGLKKRKYKNIKVQK